MEKKKGKKILILIGILVFAIIILLISIEMLSNSSSKKKEYKSINDFSSIQEMVEYMKCKYIKEKKSAEKDYDLDVYLELYKDLYTDGNSNEEYYTKLINNIAGVSKFKNIRMIDEKKDITIAIKCDKENKTIEEVKINGIENYFNYKKTNIERKSYKENRICFQNIKSKEINALINNNWNVKNINFGSKDSYFNSYDIYFDEGIEVRSVDSKVYNIIFTKKYNDEIVEGIKTNTDLNEILERLGEQEFGNLSDNILGYVFKDAYIFFEKDVVSVYPNVNEDTSKFEKLLEKYIKDNNEKELMKELTTVWMDYDQYEYDTDFFNIVYSKKGVKISYNVDENDRNKIV